MICYKDQTFCPFYEDCVSKFKCGRAMTPTVVKAAADFGLPISRYSEKPSCHVLNETPRSEDPFMDYIDSLIGKQEMVTLKPRPMPKYELKSNITHDDDPFIVHSED